MVILMNRDGTKLCRSVALQDQNCPTHILRKSLETIDGKRILRNNKVTVAQRERREMLTGVSGHLMK